MLHASKALFIWIAIATAGIANTCRGTQLQETLLTNGNFRQWGDGKPIGWNIGIGAQNGGDQPASTIRQADDAALELSGNAQTLAWNFVKQLVPVTAEGTYRLRFAARAKGIKRELNQYDNCYVGVFLHDSNGTRLGQHLAVITTENYLPQSLSIRVPPSVTSAELMIFLSKTGTLSVKECEFERLLPEQSFEIFVDEMSRSYSFLDLKKIDWPVLVKKYQPLAAKAKSRSELADVIADMLAELQDMHTYVVDGKRQLAKFKSAYTPNFDFKIVDRDLQSKQSIGNFGVVGTTSSGLGYVRITTLSNIDRSTVKKMMQAVQLRFDLPGFIVDLRQNPGGNEAVAAAIAGLFAADTNDYARQQFRCGPSPADMLETTPRRLMPTPDNHFTKPIVCLIGPGAVSSAEGMALMFKSLSHCTVIGQPTRGASGNPSAIQLPNGLDVYFSRWVSLELDGTPIEGRGVLPSITVDHTPGNDATYQRAVVLLGEKVK